MAKRIAPEGGYVGGSKNQYRRNVWAAFKRNVTAPALCNTLLMPSIEGKEIEIAMAAGFRQERMHVVDNNPAIVATLKRRYPKITTYGVDLVTAAARMVKAGVRIHCANFDLCGTAQSNGSTVEAVRATGLLPFGLWSVSFARGREGNIADVEYAADVFVEQARQVGMDGISGISVIHDYSRRDLGRTTMAIGITGYQRTVRIAHGRYRTKAHPMGWAAVCAHPVWCECDTCFVILEPYIRKGINADTRLTDFGRHYLTLASIFDLVRHIGGASSEEEIRDWFTLFRSNGYEFSDMFESCEGIPSDRLHAQVYQ